MPRYMPFVYVYIYPTMVPTYIEAWKNVQGYEGANKFTQGWSHGNHTIRTCGQVGGLMHITQCTRNDYNKCKTWNGKQH
jgi:hypothetical protein